ncbi:hypothetical protein BJ165DRAFT_1411331 [Panaeolus papilionaceus]|nr:hypothetical protein BJ165DRAFT_1411331 [Panaeolus papilionaceus]
MSGLTLGLTLGMMSLLKPITKLLCMWERTPCHSSPLLPTSISRPMLSNRPKTRKLKLSDSQSTSSTVPGQPQVIKLPNFHSNGYPVYQSFPTALMWFGQAHTVDYSEELNKMNKEWLKNPSVRGGIPVKTEAPCSPTMLPAALQPMSPANDFIQHELEYAKFCLETAKRYAVDAFDLDKADLEHVVSVFALTNSIIDLVNDCRNITNSYDGGSAAFVHCCMLVMQKVNDQCANFHLSSKDSNPGKSTISSLLKTKVAKKGSGSKGNAAEDLAFVVDDLQILTAGLSLLGFPTIPESISNVMSLSLSGSPAPVPDTKIWTLIPVLIPGMYDACHWKPGMKDPHVKIIPSMHTFANPFYFHPLRLGPCMRDYTWTVQAHASGLLLDSTVHRQWGLGEHCWGDFRGWGMGRGI